MVRSILRITFVIAFVSGLIVGFSTEAQSIAIYDAIISSFHLQMPDPVVNTFGFGGPLSSFATLEISTGSGVASATKGTS